MLKMYYEEYNKMMDFCKQFVSKDGGTRPLLEYIHLTYAGNVARAEALDVCKGGFIQLSIYECEEAGEILLPVTEKMKRSDYIVTISDLGKEIEIKTLTRTSIYKKPEGKFYDTSVIYPQDEPSEVFGFDPSLLADALKAFKNEDVVKIEYRGPYEPLIIKSNTAQALVMPKKLPR